MSKVDLALLQSALQGFTTVPAQLQIVDDVDDATLAAELEMLGDLPR
jgi:hypothetical protein